MNDADPDINDLKKSTFLTKADLGPNGSLFTIVGVEQVNTAKDGAPAEMKWALNLQESEKPFIVNSTNGQIIAQFAGSTKMRVWAESHTKIVIYFDPNVSYAGKLTGGLRCRAPRNPQPARPGQAAAPTPPPAHVEPDGPPDADVSF